MIKKILDIRFDQQFIKPYIQRIKQDAGAWRNETATKQFQKLCKDYNMLDSIRFAWLGEAGYKQRTSGINTFWTKLYSLVVPQAKYGPELITNQADREFSSDTGFWSKEAGINISNGSANYTGGTASLTRLNIVLTDRRYKISFRVLNYVSGSVRGNIGASTSPYVNANGNYSYYITSLGTYISFNGNNFIGSIDNISVVEVINSLDGSPTDATQTTSTNQPYLSGNIAPNEKWCMKNPNGGDEHMTHPTISFAANEAWSMSIVFNWNYTPEPYNGVISSTESMKTTLNFKWNNINKYYIRNSSGNLVNINVGTTDLIGKNKIITYTASGDNTIKVYRDANLIGTFTTPSNVNFNSFFAGDSGALYRYFGSLSAYIIRAQALTPTQVAAEANFLRSLYPEIPSVTIGSQVWATSNCEMVATPQGNLIANVTANTNTEKVVNGGFDTDTNWTKQAAWTISEGTANCNGTAGLIYQNILSNDKWYRFTYTVSNLTAGSVYAFCGTGSNGISRSTNGTFTEYLKTGSTTNAGFGGAGGFNGSIDNVSVQEIGWAGSTELYNAIYAATSGTDEQKTYAAVKAAAMWCYYNNDPALGAVYGKLYNWYSVKLLQMDIDYYNAANPSTPWGWRVPTGTDFNTLATTLGGVSVAGGKMKVAGTTYWNSPNTGADNSSGFSVIGTGVRAADGSFTAINTQTIIISMTSRYRMLNSDAGFTQLAIDVLTGVSLRLIKS